jgi:hypothetical protein
MSKKAALFVCPLLLFLWIGPVRSLWAQNQVDGALEGLKAIHVRVHLNMDSGSKELKLTPDLLKSDAEGLLSDAGLKVVSEEEFQRLLPSRGYPIATFDIDSKILKPGDAAYYIFYFDIKVRQPTFLSRKPVVNFLAPTWETTNIGAIDSASAIRDMLKQGVNSFIGDFKGENP